MTNDAPDGFTVVTKTKGRQSRQGLYAQVYVGTIQFSGSEAMSLAERATLAVNGSRFAMRDHTDGEYKLTKQGRSLANRQCGCRQLKDMPNGRYRGEKQGEWWIFTTVEDDAATTGE